MQFREFEDSILDNPRADRVKYLRSLATPKGQAKAQKFIATSQKVIAEALIFWPEAVQELYLLPEIELPDFEDFTVTSESAEAETAETKDAETKTSPRKSALEIPEEITEEIEVAETKTSQQESLSEIPREILAEITEEIPREIPVYRALGSVLDSVDQNSQGAIAVISLPEPLKSVADLIAESDSQFAVVCCDIRDPGNLGSIIRLADAFSAAAVFLLKGCTSAISVKSLRASAGSFFHLPVLAVADFAELAEILEIPALSGNAGWLSLATVANGDSVIAAEQAFSQGNPSKSAQKRLLIFGNESQGLPPEIVELADLAVQIPTPGAAESLGVASAAAILMYLASRTGKIVESEPRKS
jgi:TrmH family RNA methyltransferase